MKVTVITAVLNGIETIEQCINSVQGQTYANIEHIIIDGGSTDGTVDYLKSINVPFYSAIDAGVYDAINKGIAFSSGAIIHTLNADDYYANSEVVSVVVNHFSEHNIDLCHGFVEQVDIHGKSVWTIGANIDKASLLKRMKAAHPSVFVKKCIYDKYGAYSVGFKIAADHDFLLRVWDKVKVGFISKVFVKMGMRGLSNTLVYLSYKESAAISLLHGRNIFIVPFSFVWQVFKHKVIVSFMRKLGYRKK